MGAGGDTGPHYFLMMPSGTRRTPESSPPVHWAASAKIARAFGSDSHLAEVSRAARRMIPPDPEATQTRSRHAEQDRSWFSFDCRAFPSRQVIPPDLQII